MSKMLSRHPFKTHQPIVFENSFLAKISHQITDVTSSPFINLGKHPPKNTGLFGNFSQHGGPGGVFSIPKTKNQKKVPLNHPKITQKTN